MSEKAFLVDSCWKAALWAFAGAKKEQIKAEEDVDVSFSVPLLSLQAETLKTPRFSYVFHRVGVTNA